MADFDDLLRGARAIAKFLFGDEKYCRRVFHLHATGRLPTFTFGTAGICARKSTLLNYVEQQERKNVQPKDPR
jgi:hypothetical protein